MKELPTGLWPVLTPFDNSNQLDLSDHKMKIAGTIWYQGESKTPNANSYSELFTTMTKGWREKFHKFQ